jgi:hypothetical protein
LVGGEFAGIAAEIKRRRELVSLSAFCLCVFGGGAAISEAEQDNKYAKRCV